MAYVDWLHAWAVFLVVTLVDGMILEALSTFLGAADVVLELSLRWRVLVRRITVLALMVTGLGRRGCAPVNPLFQFACCAALSGPFSSPSIAISTVGAKQHSILHFSKFCAKIALHCRAIAANILTGS